VKDISGDGVYSVDADAGLVGAGLVLYSVILLCYSNTNAIHNSRVYTDEARNDKARV
jgi:hypothetical protein